MNIINKKKIKIIKNKIDAIGWSINSIKILNEISMWSKQLLMSQHLIETSIDNKKEIINKAEKLMNSISLNINSKISDHKLIANDNETPFLIKAKKIFLADDYLLFREFWADMEEIINDTSKLSSMEKIKKIYSFSNFYTKFLLNSKNEINYEPI